MQTETKMTQDSNSDYAIPELDLAIERGEISVRTYFSTAWTMAYHSDLHHRKEVGKRYPKIRRMFESQMGSIVLEHICQNILGGVILTGKGGVYLGYTPQDVGPLNNLLFRCADQTREVERLLRGGDRLSCNQKYYVVMAEILDYIDARKAPAEGRIFSQSGEGDVLSHLEERLRQANRYFDRDRARSAAIVYFTGMLFGALMMLAVGYAAYHFASPHFAFSFFGGAIGAIVSVLTRMTRRKLDIESDAERLLLILFGAFRVIVGAVFGLVVFGMVKGNILPLKIPDAPEAANAFFATLGFVAGFAERTAQHTIESSAGKLLGSGQEKVDS